MDIPERKFMIHISEQGRSVAHTWITEEQKNFIAQYILNSTPASRNSLSVEQIIETVCTYLNVRMQLLPTRTRLAPVTYARQMCFYFFVRELKYTTARAGRIFFRDHATVLHALGKLKADKHQRNINEIASLLNSKSGLFAYESNGVMQPGITVEPHIAEI